ncbi:MAG TPA: esterase-like activity of phytase family protein [Novosphingobium sp.]|nr:esterase-like activity of phytase family protein [Novosphingobium sp.]
MRRRAIVPVLLAAMALATLPRDAPRRPDSRQIVSFRALPHPATLGPGVAVAGAWLVTSPNSEFGSYSALASLDETRLAAFSDRGARLVFSVPDLPAAPASRIDLLAATRGTASKRERDCEAVARDPASGSVWAAYEQTNTIVRYGAEGAVTGRARPAAMRAWPANRGPEAMARLGDGRFVVLGEVRVHGRHRALRFDRDPVEGGTPVPFEYAPPAGFRPTDMAVLPDGRVVVLNRELLFPWRFRAALTVLDPSEIRPGKVWRGREIARLGPAGPADNYEGLAVVPRGDGRVTLWLISDDNQAALVQRTLLLKLVWTP